MQPSSYILQILLIAILLQSGANEVYAKEIKIECNIMWNFALCNYINIIRFECH